jgi:hypothetical protein
VTRALGIALASAAALGAIVVAFLMIVPPEPRRRPSQPREAPRRPPPGPVRVLAGETPDLAVVLKDRYADPARAEFTDRALAEALGAARETRFVEVWTVNRGPSDLAHVPVPACRVRDGGAAALRPLESLLEGRAPSPRARMLLAGLGSGAAGALRKGAFRRSVYALPLGASFADLASADAGGVRLEPRETTEAAIEAWFERPRPDLLAALDQAAPGAASRAQASTEDSR